MVEIVLNDAIADGSRTGKKEQTQEQGQDIRDNYKRYKERDTPFIALAVSRNIVMDIGDAQYDDEHPANLDKQI